MRLRAALRNLRALHGTWPKLAAVMGVPVKRLQNIASGSHPSAAVALATARAAGATVDALLGAPSDASVCPTCGAKRGGSA
jgi:transcriptional regulator with XRE-family HTH domain